MYSFANDYSEGCAAPILEALVKHNYEQSVGYGLDDHCKNAAALIRKEIGRDDLDVHFIPGGTPANILGIVSALKPYEAVICADSGHINVHETGSIEATGHKILSAPGVNGKITPAEIEDFCVNRMEEHTVYPKMVFVSDATEYGTIYTKKELSDIAAMCKKHGLYLYLDGARIGSALVAKGNDMTLADIAELTDMFYIGGTKNGALLGEAMVIRNEELKKGFRYHLKQRGAMLAKGAVMGIAFEELFKDGLYFRLAKNANLMAMSLKEIFKRYDIPFFMETTTNQIFPILPDTLLKKIEEKYTVTFWEKYDETHSVVRFVCSWATQKEALIDFYKDFSQMVKENDR
ncbi:MAG: threonine aldolase [Erysipelotrichaceae bacterium]|nr:threonine aldolase [Erysipelotrichaceae bacterium]